LAISLSYNSGEEGGISLVQNDFYLPSRAYRKGEGVGTLWGDMICAGLEAEKACCTGWHGRGLLNYELLSNPTAGL
jgi:hypothetical protein